MTHEEIEAAIGRVQTCGCENVPEVVIAFMNDPADNHRSFKDKLIELLGQANRDGWMKLPKDADGVPIRVNDKMTLNYSSRVVEVVAVGECGFYYVDGEASLLYYSEAACCHHYNKPTVEDVMVEYLKECLSHESELKYFTNKGRERAWRDIAATFAERMREAADDD